MRKLRFWLVMLTVLVLLIGAATPVLAKVEGEPELEATLLGSNEFQVGQDITMQIAIQNNGTFSSERMSTPSQKVMAVGYLTPTGVTLVPPCTTAVSLTARLSSESPSIEVLSETAFIGTLARGTSTMQPPTFKIRIGQDAEPGTYPLTVELEYEYLSNVYWVNSGDEGLPNYEPEFDFAWSRKTESEEISIRVVGTYFSAAVIQAEEVRAGTTGIVTVNIQNSGSGVVHEVTAEIVPGNSLSPIGPASYLGDILGGNSVTTQFKVSVSEEAIAKTVPVDILIKYKDEEEVAGQSLLTVGVPVEGKLQLEVQPVQADSSLTPGTETIIEIPIMNTSGHEVKDAIARINVVDPFSTAPLSTTDDTAYVGTLQPGDTGTARFKISVDADAVPKAYTLEVQVKYTDSLGNSYISDPITSVITVQPPSGIPVTTIVLIALAVVVLLGIILYRVRRSKKPG